MPTRKWSERERTAITCLMKRGLPLEIVRVIMIENRMHSWRVLERGIHMLGICAYWQSTEELTDEQYDALYATDPELQYTPSIYTYPSTTFLHLWVRPPRNGQPGGLCVFYFARYSYDHAQYHAVFAVFLRRVFD